MNFVWKKQSYKRWGADVGPLRIEVQLVGLGDSKHWVAGEIFGNHHHGGSHDSQGSLEEAQEAAERIAARLLSEASDVMNCAAADATDRGPSRSRTMGGRR